MEEQKALARKRRRAVIALAAIAAIALAACAARFAAVHAADPAEGGQQQAEEQAAVAEQQAELTEEQRRAVAAYGQHEAAVIEVLTHERWVSVSGTSQVEFTDSEYVETQSGKSYSQTYAVSSVERDTVSRVEQTTGQTEVHEVWRFVITTPTASRIAVLDCNGAVDDGRWTLSGDGFRFATEYIPSPAPARIAIEGLGTAEGLAMLTLAKADEGGFLEDLSTWVLSNCPTARSATWSRAFVVDYQSGILSTSFKLDDYRKSQVSASFSLSDGAATFSTAGW